MKVFVYGTLKPGGKYYHLYCAGKTIKEEKCWTYGNIYSLSLGYPAMTKGNGKVHGYLLTFPDAKALVNLDKLEGYQENRQRELNDYQREKITIYDYDNNPIKDVWTYFMDKDKIDYFQGVLVASGNWKDENLR